MTQRRSDDRYVYASRRRHGHSRPAPLSNLPHAEENVRLVRRGGGQASCGVDPGHRLVCRELVLSDSARCHAGSDVAGAARPGLPLRGCLHRSVVGGRHSWATRSAYFLYELLGLWLMQPTATAPRSNAFQQKYREWGAWFILIKGLATDPLQDSSPSCLGSSHSYPILPFILLSLLTRGVRFFVVLCSVLPPLRRPRA